jgi:hypothetical protein
MFVGVESFDRKTLLGVHKAQNQPAEYGRIVELCRQNGIMSHLSNTFHGCRFSGRAGSG